MKISLEGYEAQLPSVVLSTGPSQRIENLRDPEHSVVEEGLLKIAW